MGKVIFWIVVVFAVLFALRLYGAAKAKARRSEAERRDAADPAAASGNATMVRCVQCGVFLPKSEALPAPTGYRCGDPGCAERR